MRFVSEFRDILFFGIRLTGFIKRLIADKPNAEKKADFLPLLMEFIDELFHGRKHGNRGYKGSSVKVRERTKKTLHKFELPPDERLNLFVQENLLPRLDRLVQLTLVGGYTVI